MTKDKAKIVAELVKTIKTVKADVDTDVEIEINMGWSVATESEFPELFKHIRRTLITYKKKQLVELEQKLAAI